MPCMSLGCSDVAERIQRTRVSEHTYLLCAKTTQFHHLQLCCAMGLALHTAAVLWGCCMVHHGMAEPGLGLYQLEGGELIRPHRTSVLLRPFPCSTAVQLGRMSCISNRNACQENLLMLLLR